MQVVSLVVGARGAGQDRAAVRDVAGGVLIALADGAGGTTGGAVAAERVVGSLGALRADGDLLAHVCALDDPRQLGGGQATAVLAHVTPGAIAGVSVGDSVAWLVDDAGAVVALTAAQRRKPLLGTGEAIVTPFAHGPWTGTLVIASDGLAAHAGERAIGEAVARAATVEQAAAALVARARLPAGGLPDDVAVVLARRA